VAGGDISVAEMTEILGKLHGKIYYKHQNIFGSSRDELMGGWRKLTEVIRFRVSV
jgi:hypothetical protein